MWGGLGESTDGLIRKAAEQRANRLTHAEFEREATWATRKFVPFVMQRISVAVQIAAATEIRQALGRGMGPDLPDGAARVTAGGSLPSLMRAGSLS